MTTPALIGIENVLSDDETSILWDLGTELSNRRPAHWESELYYTGQQRLRNIGIAIPPHMAKIDTAMGWPRIVADSLEERLDVQAFRYPNAATGDDYLTELWTANNLAEESQLAHLDAVIYGHAFVVVGTNDDDKTHPFITVESPLYMAMAWDARERRVTAALRVYTDDGLNLCTLYLPDSTITLELGSNGGLTVVDRDDHNQGVVPVVRMANRQRISDRAGSSEITPEIRAITDACMRTLLGVEVAREFYSAPQRYILGAPESAFQDSQGNPRSAWETYIGRVLALERDEDGNAPTVGQFDPYTPAAYTSVVELYGKLIVAQTGLPPQYLGLTYENPASADAIQMGEQRLVKRAERRQRAFGGAWESAMRLALQWAGQSPDGANQIQTLWRDASTPTLAAQVDATVKLVQAGILPATSDVTLELAGFDPATRTRIAKDQRTAQAQAARTAMLAGIQGQPVPGAANDAQAANQPQPKGIPGNDPSSRPVGG